MKRKHFLKYSGLALGSLALFSFKEIEKQKPVFYEAPKLLKGDTIAIFAPAGVVVQRKHIDKLKSVLNQKGFKVILASNLNAKYGYLAGDDAERLHAFHKLISNKQVKALIAVRGGWGCARMLEGLDLELIKKNPKIIMGYSDLTSLLNYITYTTGLITYHGPMAYSTWNKLALDEFERCFESQKQNTKLPFLDKEYYSNQKGQAKGRLVGGNLTVLCQTLSSFYQPQFKNNILFLEETKEEPYVIDRFLTQLRDAKLFEELSGIVLGKFNDCVPEDPEISLTLLEVFDYHFKDLSIPVFGFANFGHVKNKYIIEIGREAEINTVDFSIKLV